MNILLCRWNSICETGIIKALQYMGHTLTLFDEAYANPDYDTNYIKSLASYIQQQPNINCVLSVNFIPLVAKVCKIYSIPYLSWIADCPCMQLYSQAIELPTNYIFSFDKYQTLKFESKNPNRIFHLPLASDVETDDSLELTKEDFLKYGADVSFIGTLYTEKCEYSKIQHLLPEYVNGYCEGLMRAQQNVYGYNFIEDAITDEFAKKFKSYANWALIDDYQEDIKGLVADKFLGVRCSSYDRIDTLNSVGRNFNTDLWSMSDPSIVPHVNFRGGADSKLDMPKIFKCSKINLNITLKTIRSGIPQRIFDILGVGGFQITNYQPELFDLFSPGEDLVYYDSIPDLLSKIEYYLSHEDERLQIAQNGYEKVKKHHTYVHRLTEMLDQINI